LFSSTTLRRCCGRRSCDEPKAIASANHLCGHLLVDCILAVLVWLSLQNRFRARTGVLYKAEAAELEQDKFSQWGKTGIIRLDGLADPLFLACMNYSLYLGERCSRFIALFQVMVSCDDWLEACISCVQRERSNLHPRLASRFTCLFSCHLMSLRYMTCSLLFEFDHT
jgi:hypothetical protein